MEWEIHLSIKLNPFASSGEGKKPVDPNTTVYDMSQPGSLQQASEAGLFTVGTKDADEWDDLPEC